MAQLIFKRGSLANLSGLAIKDGQFIVTTDEGALYVDNGTTRVRLGDFIVVENVAALPTAGANRKAMYYCEAENVLARWNGTEWKQINKQPTTAELKVALGLDAEGAVTAAIAAAQTAGDNAQLTVDNLTTYVGTIPNDENGQPMAASVVAYINKKTDGIATSGNLEALGNRVGTVEGKVATIEGDYLKGADKTELEGKITAAQTAADNAQGAADGVAGNLSTHEADAVKHITAAEREAWNGKTTMADVEAKGYLVASDIAGKADKTQVATDIATAVETETNNRVAADDAIKASIGTVAEGKTVVKMIEEAQAAATYDDTALDGRVTAVEGDVATIKGDYLKASDKTELQNSINGVAGDVAGIASDYLKAEDKTALQNAINGKVAQSDYDTKMGEIDLDLEGLQTQINTIMNNPDAEGAINSINEFTQYVADHGTIADGFRKDIDQNKADIAAEVKRAGEAESALSGRIDTLEGINHDAYIAADSALKTELEGKINAKADSSALTAAVDTLEAADEELAGKIAVLEGKFTGDGSVEDQIATAKQEAIDAAAGDATTKANKALEDAKKYADDEDAKIEARLDALELIDHEHSNKALLDTYTQTEENLADAVAKKHEHANAAELAKISDGDVAKWNGAQAAAEANAAAALATARTEISAEIDADVLVETNRARGAEEGLQSAINTVSGNLTTYQTNNDAVVALKANASNVYTKTEVENMLTWSEF